MENLDDKQRGRRGMVTIEPPERSRTYYFPNGEVLSLKNVNRVEVRDSGKHRVETVEGHKVFVNTGWIWIDIDVDNWTF